MVDALLMRSCALCCRLFWICRSHDRGHAYCGDTCRRKGRIRSLRRAQSTYQSSPEGRADQCERMRAYRKEGRRRVIDQRSEKLAVSVNVVAPEHARDFAVKSDDMLAHETDDRIDNRGDSAGSEKSPNPGAQPPSMPIASGPKTPVPLVVTRITGTARGASRLSVDTLRRCIVCGRIGEYCFVGDTYRNTRSRRQ